MTPAEMLEKLSWEGRNAASDYDDGDGCYFGWEIKDGKLRAWWIPIDEDSDYAEGEKVTHEWRITDA